MSCRVACYKTAGDKCVGVVVAIDASPVMARSFGIVAGDDAIEHYGIAVIKSADACAVAAAGPVICNDAVRD
jgi:hypothetical protein